jgi:hypothetical protein
MYWIYPLTNLIAQHLQHKLVILGDTGAVDKQSWWFMYSDVVIILKDYRKLLHSTGIVNLL